MSTEENEQLSPEEEVALRLLGQYGPTGAHISDIRPEVLEVLVSRGLVTIAAEGRYTLTVAGRQISQNLAGTNDAPLPL